MSREDTLRKKIWEREKMYERRKKMLALKTWVVFGIILYLIAFMFRWMQEPIEYLTGIIIALVTSGIFMFIGILVLTPLLNLRENELSTIARLKMELECAEKISARSNAKNSYSLSFEGEKRKETGTYNVYGSDMALSDENKK